MSNLFNLVGANLAGLLGGGILGVSAAGLGAAMAGLAFGEAAQIVSALVGIITTGLIVKAETPNH